MLLHFPTSRGQHSHQQHRDAGLHTGLDLLDGGERGSVGAQGHAAVAVAVAAAAVPVAVAVHVALPVAGHLGGGQHGGRPIGGVGEERAAEALPAALSPVAVDGRLELVGVAQRPLVTLVGVEVLHVSGGGGGNTGGLRY